MQKLLLFSILLISLCTLGSCKEEKAPRNEKAKQEAIAAAKKVLSADTTNMMKFQSTILSVKALQSEYLLKGDTASANYFDETFRAYIAENDQNLAKQLFM